MQARSKIHCQLLLIPFAVMSSVCIALAQAPTSNPRPEAPWPELEARACLQQLRSVMERCERLMLEGRRSEANALLISVFPEPGRTPLQGFLLANTLYEQDPKLSYRLHKAAAAAYPENSQVILEWALEQHRAREWAGALAAYKAFSEFKPDQAPPYGMAAECALRLGRTAEAVELWQKSEKAPGGKLEDFETLLCAVHGPRPADDRREELLTQCRTGDQAAAVSLIALDLEWPRDWWNGGPHARYLKADLATIGRLMGNPDRELRFAMIAGKIAAEETGDADARHLIEDFGLPSDKPVIPSNGRVLSRLLSYLDENQIAGKEALRKKLGPVLELRAKESGDPEFHNARAWLFLDTPQMEAIDRLAWEKTGDERFAASLLVELSRQGRLKPDSPELFKALKEFPDNSIIASIRLRLLGQNDPGRQQALEHWILAQYTKLEPGGMLGRPSARPLGFAFEALAELLRGKSE